MEGCSEAQRKRRGRATKVERERERARGREASRLRENLLLEFLMAAFAFLQ